MNVLVEWTHIHLSQKFEMLKVDCISQGCTGCLVLKVPVDYSISLSANAYAWASPPSTSSLLEIPADKPVCFQY